MFQHSSLRLFVIKRFQGLQFFKNLFPFISINMNYELHQLFLQVKIASTTPCLSELAE